MLNQLSIQVSCTALSGSDTRRSIWIIVAARYSFGVTAYCSSESARAAAVTSATSRQRAVTTRM